MTVSAESAILFGHDGNMRQVLMGALWRVDHSVFRITAPIAALGLRPRRDMRVPLEAHGGGGGRYFIVPPLEKDAVVYSLGIGDDIRFERSIIARYGVRIRAFDPFVDVEERPAEIIFDARGVAAIDGEIDLVRIQKRRTRAMRTTLSVGPRGSKHQRIRMARLATLLAEQGLDHIDLLKIDVEGAEYEILEDALRSDIRIEQIAIQFHPHVLHLSRRGVMIGRSGWRRMKEIVDAFRRRGLSVVWRSRRGTELTLARVATSGLRAP